MSKHWITCLVLIMSMACSPVNLITVTVVVTATPEEGAASTETVLPTSAATRAEQPLAPTVAPAPTQRSAPVTTDGPTLAGCPVFPADDIWNTQIDSAPVDPNSEAYIASIGADKGLHPDFGSGLYDGEPIGIPYTIADSSTPRTEVSFDYDDESDAGPYPIPADVNIEGGPDGSGDRHIVVVEKDTCKLYELYDAYPNGDGWDAGSGAIWDLKGYDLRPEDWTSADAAGLPILPGLVRYDEVVSGEIKHALRFTADETQAAYLWPARHEASGDESAHLPPMGQRFRLKASFDVSQFPPNVQVILVAMQRYGLILADNGSSWFISGTPDDHWNNDELVESFREVKGSDFEAVDVSDLMINSDSSQAQQH